jgi:hypothetical protein
LFQNLSNPIMQYAILVYENPKDIAERESPAYLGAFAAYSQALESAGVMTGGAGLLPAATATTVRVKNEKRLVSDGPFADSKEQLGGFFLIEAPDLDSALAWASRCPAASRAGVEVRPVMVPPEGTDAE